MSAETPATAVAAPAWFRTATDDPGEPGVVAVDGIDVAYRAWGSRKAPTLLLVHGGAAHAHWWAAHAPIWSVHHRVVALDLSGHGDSGWRRRYDAATWAREVLAVAADGGGSGRPVVVGHSMGGLVAVFAAAHHGAELDGVIVLDAPIRVPDPESDEGRAGGMFRAPKTYPDLATAMRHFHLVPPQPCDNRWILEHTALHSLRRTHEGWTWKFDPDLFTRRSGPMAPSDFGSDLARAACRVAIVNGALSDVVDDEVRETMAGLLAGSPAGAAGVPFVEVPEARHHLLFDQPLAVVTAIRAVLATWRPVGTPPAPVPGDRDGTGQA